MAKKYCVCGFVTEYDGATAPKVCKACNKPFASAFVVAAQSVVQAKPKRRILAAAEDEEDGEEVYEGEIVLPDRSSFQVNIAQRVSIAGIAQGATPVGLDKHLPQIEK